ncbi:unnamed protein product [Kuraishia capsulata CBS 1993]|uniref:Uncharacterized protein n=1 Tax=Kuraishia capsulata CBS 1993 TaxID=1382522 RepID=W6MTB8_9ASCO|nr:uncharacterized protein KUCA_T00005651001 [Kuraishia capsulata CBS 1993]CDK29658.1 unnamed protein product [Kuraishia capsulata CBS 1993]
MRSFIKSHKRGVSLDSDQRSQPERMPLVVNTRTSSETYTIASPVSPLASPLGPLSGSPDISGISPRRSRNPIKKFLKQKSSSGNLNAAAIVTSKQQSPKLRSKSSFSNLASHKIKNGKSTSHSGSSPLLAISGTSPTIYGTKTHEWGTSPNLYSPSSLSRPENFPSKISLPSIDEGSDHHSFTSFPSVDFEPQNVGIRMTRVHGIHSETDLGTYDLQQKASEGFDSVTDFSIVYISKTTPKQESIKDQADVADDPESDNESVVSRESSQFSFEENMKSGRNSSIKYYKSKDQLEREQKIFDEERAQANAMALADEFDDLDVEDAQLINSLGYADPYEEDDTDALFNRKLFGSDDEMPQSNVHGGSENESDFQNFSDFDDEMVMDQTQGDAGHEAIMDNDELYSIAKIPTSGEYDADGEFQTEEEGDESLDDVQNYVYPEGLPNYRSSEHITSPLASGSQIHELLGRISLQREDVSEDDEKSQSYRTSTLDSNATFITGDAPTLSIQSPFSGSLVFDRDPRATSVSASSNARFKSPYLSHRPPLGTAVDDDTDPAHRFSWFPNDDTLNMLKTSTRETKPTVQGVNQISLMKPVYFHHKYEDPSSEGGSDGSVIDEINQVPADFDFRDFDEFQPWRGRSFSLQSPKSGRSVPSKGRRSNSLLNHPSKSLGVPMSSSTPVRTNSFETNDKTVTLFNVNRANKHVYSSNHSSFGNPLSASIAEIDVSSCDDEDMTITTPTASFPALNQTRPESSPLTTISENSFDSSGYYHPH